VGHIEEAFERLVLARVEAVRRLERGAVGGLVLLTFGDLGERHAHRVSVAAGVLDRRQVVERGVDVLSRELRTQIGPR